MIKITLESENNTLQYDNYGDVNFADYGRLVAKDGGYGYSVICCNFDYDAKNWVITEDYVDIDDDWIDVEAVESYADVSKEDDPKAFAVAVIDYYGTQNPYGTMKVDSAEGEAYLNSLNTDAYWDADI